MELELLWAHTATQPPAPTQGAGLLGPQRDTGQPWVTPAHTDGTRTISFLHTQDVRQQSPNTYRLCRTSDRMAHNGLYRLRLLIQNLCLHAVCTGQRRAMGHLVRCGEFREGVLAAAAGPHTPTQAVQECQHHTPTTTHTSAAQHPA
jgi:hypothetical protein